MADQVGKGVVLAAVPDLANRDDLRLGGVRRAGASGVRVGDQHDQG